MTERILYPQDLLDFRDYLVREEKSQATIEKYVRDAKMFLSYSAERCIEKALTVAYKQHLQEKGYKIRSVNSMLASLNSLLDFMGWGDCKVKALRYQPQTYCPAEKELTKVEYLRLLEAARKQRQLYLIIQTICATGIRVSELQYFTVESIRSGEITVRCKNKTRTILVPGKLKRLLLDYAKSCGVCKGPVFVTKRGTPLDRCRIWLQMKKLCAVAKVRPDKVFPHNLRKLFARTFYKLERDIAKLADILGHSSINTTRIYIMSTGAEHRRKIERLGLIM